MFELHKDEKVILYIRRHWIFLLFQTKIVFLLFLFPVVIIWMAQVWGLVPDVNLLGVSIFSVSDILIYLWGLFCWMLLAEKFTDYALDFWVVTNKRIIESELLKLFDVKISTLELQDIEDITVRSHGFWANIIGYGRLDIQTAGAVNEFYAEYITDPAKVQKIIFDAKLAHQQEIQNIEKEEVEQISARVFREESQVSKPELLKTNDQYDWAMIDERQAADRRNVEEVVEVVEDKFKKDIDKALKGGE